VCAGQTSGLFDRSVDIMLINFVKDSVLQCFCHTCRAPLPPAGEILRGEAVRYKLIAARGVTFS
jgi:hypothetical protein